MSHPSDGITEADHFAIQAPVNRKILLDTLIKHETLTVEDVAKEENLGVVANKEHLGFLLSELVLSGDILVLAGAHPVTYTITQKGIDEGRRLEVNKV